jgi:hypothetical protein
VELVTVGDPVVVEFVIGAVLAVGLAAVCAATCKPHVKDTHNARNTLQADGLDIFAIGTRWGLPGYR